MKALEILKQIKDLSGWIKCGAELPYDNELENAIAELESLQQPKNCDGCKYEHKDAYSLPCAACVRNCDSDYYEPK